VEPSADGAPVIEARGLGRRFLMARPGELGLRASLLRALSPRSAAEPRWALRGIELSVRAGERVALLGRNGAGKSTLLSLLAGLLPPSEGTVAVRGRVSPFLRLGAGLYADLPVRENLLFCASLLGLTREQALARLPDIAAFGELEPYLDARLGALSSGFQARAALAAALHCDLDLLLVDEVFAVGDQDFQRRCLERMAALQALGKTYVLATHDLELARSFCTRGVVLERGRMTFDGPAADAAALYGGRRA
jgi:ABC-2 type transport system ATP-binding protein